MMRIRTFVAAACTVLIAAPPSALCVAAARAAPPRKSPPKAAAKPRKPSKAAPPAPEESRGTTQMKGANGVFGTVYTLQNGWNFQLLSARYTLEGHGDYNGTMPTPEEKLLVLTYAIKNSTTGDLDTGGFEFQLVNENENLYDLSSTRLAANGAQEFHVNLKPGQGLGQDPAVNALTAAAPLPRNAKIKKIILKQGRKAVPDEQVLRFEVAGYPSGSPKNVIAPLPQYAADPTDPTGAVALSPARALAGRYYPDGYFNLRFNSLAISDTETNGGQKPEDGKTYAVASFTAKNVYPKGSISTFELTFQLDAMVLRDADGEKYKPVSSLVKAKRDEEVGSIDMTTGEEITYRVFFALPKDAKAKELIFGKNKYGHEYVVDLSAAPSN